MPSSFDPFKKDSTLYYKEMVPIVTTLKSYLSKVLPKGLSLEESASELGNAFITCNLGVFKKYFDMGLDPNIHLTGGHTFLTILLCFATSDSWVSVARYFLERGASPNAEDPTGVPVVSLLVRSGSAELLEYALECGACIENKGSSGETPLLSAIHYKQLECLKLLLIRGADPNAISADGNSPLMWAAGRSNGIGMQQSLTAVKVLLSHGSKVNFQNPRGYTPLMAASLIRESDIVHALLASGADTEITDEKGETALMKAVDGDAEEVIRLLLQFGADPNAQNKEGISPLMRATSSWVLESLLTSGAVPNLKDNSGNTPLHIQAENNNPIHVQLLLEFGASVDARNNRGDSPLQCAIRSRSFDSVNLLLDAGAFCGTVNDFGISLIHDTILPWDYFRTIDIFSKLNTPALLSELEFYTKTYRKWSHEMIKRLVSEGADCNIACAEEQVTPLMIASACGDLEGVELLLSFGAEISTSDSNDRTALFYATRSGFLEITKLLQRKGEPSTVVDKAGNIPLFYAAHFRHMKIVDLLILEFAFYYCSIKGLSR